MQKKCTYLRDKLFPLRADPYNALLRQKVRLLPECVPIYLNKTFSCTADPRVHMLKLNKAFGCAKKVLQDPNFTLFDTDTFNTP